MMWNKRWLWQVLQQPPPDGALWNGRKVADWMSELKGEKVCRLHRVGISQVHEVSIESSSPRTPGIRYPQNLRSGKKNLRLFVLKIKKQNPESDVEVWSMDEHPIGLKLVLRREWVDEFSNATTQVNWRFQWLWLYGFVHPSTGETKRVDTALCE